MMRTGEDIHFERFRSDPICALGPDSSDAIGHAVPAYLGLRTADLRAVYAYLSAFLAAESCNTVANGCPNFRALLPARKTTSIRPPMTARTRRRRSAER